MIWIMKEDLKEIISNYVAKGKFTKPLMIVATSKHISSNDIVDECKSWISEKYKVYHLQGHPFKQGNKFFFIDGKTERIIDHPEILNSVIVPSGAEESQLLLYHRYLEQLDPQHLEYVVALSYKIQKPAICLINDYSYAKYKDEGLNLSSFEICIYDAKL